MASRDVVWEHGENLYPGWRCRSKNIGKAWSKFFHIAGVPVRQADSSYFISAVRETQKWGKFSFIAMIPINLHFCIL